MLYGVNAGMGSVKSHSVLHQCSIMPLVSDRWFLTEGEILVTTMTQPNLLAAMRKAAAIVTDQGGMTSHAAVISRELGIPCVVGTYKATRIFKTGDVLEVDANKGIVRLLK